MDKIEPAAIALEEPKPTNKKAYLALAAISLFWGSTWVVSKIGVQGIPGLQLAYIRQFCAGLIFLSFFKLKGEPWPKLGDFKWLLLMSLFMIVLANGITTWGIKYVPSGMAALIGTLFPLFVVIIEMIWFRNSPNNRFTVLGMIMGIAGLSLVFYQNAFHHQPDGYVFGISLCLFSTISWSIGTILVARSKLKMNPYYAMGWQMFLGSFLIYLLAICTGNNIPFSAVPTQSWMAVSYLIAIGSVAAFVGMIYTMKHLPVAIASLYGYFNPIIALLIGAVVLKEKLTFTIIIGSLVTLVGVYIVNRSIKKR
ncbi:DMT family transporter [Aridibaculum aurantiacum]|uniref:DMT family transporter n=1 Tax=Aridibaculum aurantiacum TaxID=2810307 RepID=UPI001A96A9FD|nr:EamA family transporter [Aridibaculum aurantiacum]